MSLFWKIKEIPFLYKAKFNIRLFKQFIYQTYLLFKSNSNTFVIINFVKHFFINVEDNKEFIKKIYNEKIFNYDD